jgi:hypothetical protein
VDHPRETQHKRERDRSMGTLSAREARLQGGNVDAAHEAEGKALSLER